MTVTRQLTSWLDPRLLISRLTGLTNPAFRLITHRENRLEPCRCLVLEVFVVLRVSSGSYDPLRRELLRAGDVIHPLVVARTRIPPASTSPPSFNV